ncbi:DUF1491 family protein [Sphingomonas qomolangmaensis]|uniref:DUF1491 family protein n=1 Tax=Sphingomonas qomolangmaensis TaxID=2918765 RepID=A0ABY5L4Q2_9SPHN|nr:DUF1491 family protein [Sphingomonas qomolangmaensis]UUL81943.1 DUF1491 family protein [Sphingomonas qomolangmaensis]
MNRLAAHVRVSALLRRTHDAGGSAMVLAKGEAMGGAILVQTLDRGRHVGFCERGYGPDGLPALIVAGPVDADSQTATQYWQRRRRNDPDLWVVELDVAAAQRLVAEIIVND